MAAQLEKKEAVKKKNQAGGVKKESQLAFSILMAK